MVSFAARSAAVADAALRAAAERAARENDLPVDVVLDELRRILALPAAERDRLVAEMEIEEKRP